MAPARFTLEQIQIPKPCPVDWDSMPGDARRRYCGACGRHMHNLSAMPCAEAERFVAESDGGSSCVQVTRRWSGKVLTLDYARPERRPGAGAPWWYWGGVATIIAAITAVIMPRSRVAGGMVRRTAAPVIGPT